MHGASKVELTGNWLTDENGILDEDAARGPTAWRAGGELYMQAEAADEATEKAMDSLLAHGVVEDMKREDAKGFETLITRWDKTLEDDGE